MSKKRTPRRPPKPGEPVTRDGIPNPGGFKSGAEWTGNAGGKPKGAQLSSAALRALALPAGTIRPKRGAGGHAIPPPIVQRSGLERTEADELAENLVGFGKSGNAGEATSAFNALARLTEGDKLNLSGDLGVSDLTKLTTAELVIRRRALLAAALQAGTTEENGPKPRSRRPRKRR